MHLLAWNTDILVKRLLMRRAERLYQIALLLSRGQLLTARELAGMLDVSERTIYRDIAELIATGAPIDGEAGVGYLMRSHYRVPPLMFSEVELQALLIGTSFVRSLADSELALAAQTAMAKVSAVLPEPLRLAAQRETVLFPDFHLTSAMVDPIGVLRSAIAAREKVQFDYQGADGAVSTRVVWPLGLSNWGESWTLGAWCELRADFSTFRLDRMQEIRGTGEAFPDASGRRLQDYVAAITE